jgi:hypothetical protein
MRKSLGVFIFTKTVDVYVNAIACAFDRLDVGDLRFYYIEGTKTGQTRAEAVSTFNAILARFEDLYRKDTADIYKRLHERTLDRALKSLNYDLLNQEFENEVRAMGGPANCVVDLSGVTKCPTIDIFSICLSIGLKNVYVFELADPPDRANPDASLYHRLDSKAYAHTCVTEATPVKVSQGTLLRKRPLLWATLIACTALMLVSLVIMIFVGINNPFVQIINVAAAIVGICSPLLTFFGPKGN